MVHVILLSYHLTITTLERSLFMISPQFSRLHVCRRHFDVAFDSYTEPEL